MANKEPKLTAYYKGRLVEISQWCNDWFSLMDGRVVSPNMLMFNWQTFNEVLNHNNNGILLNIFEPVTNSKRAVKEYSFTFKRKR